MCNSLLQNPCVYMPTKMPFLEEYNYVMHMNIDYHDSTVWAQQSKLQA